MTRKIRLISCTGYYHVVLKGVGNMIIFEDSKDYRFFLNAIKRVKDEMGIEVNAYCLISNHVHLLLNDNGNGLDNVMQKLEIIYAKHYNWKYDRQGPLFKGRFFSKPIISDNQFLAVFKYIIRNPEKAGISAVEDYEWGCYMEYIDGENCHRHIIDDAKALEMFGGVAELKEALRKSFSDDERVSIVGTFATDEEVMEHIRLLYGENFLENIKKSGKKDRNKGIAMLKKNGICNSQLERITGFSRSIVQRAQ